MIRIIQNKNLSDIKIDDNTIVFTSSKNVLKYKKKYLYKDILVTTLKNYANKLLNKYSNKALATNQESMLLMWQAFLGVKKNLSKYNMINNIDFSKNLIDTYSFFIENNVLDNMKTKDLKIIYDEYEKLLVKNNLVNEVGLFDFLNNNIDKIEEDNIIFLDVDKLEDYESSFIKKLSDVKNVYVYANTINNLSFVSDLNKISKVTYDECSNSCVNQLFKIGSKDLFKDVKIIGANDLYEEVRFIKNDIKKKINEGLNYKDILVVSKNINRYDSYFKLLFDFPYTKSVVTGTLTKNFIELFKSIIDGDFSCANFISILKLGIFKLSSKTIDELDNYVYIWDLEDKPFYDEFIYNPSGKKDFSSHDEEKLKELNESRISIINPIRYLLENIIEECNITELLRYLFTYFDEEDIAANLFKKDYDGYEMLISNLELINDMYKDSNITEVFEVLNMLQSVISTTTQMIDEVNVYSLDTYVSGDYKCVYFIGLTEKDIPSKFDFNTLINSNDLSDETILNIIKRHTDEQQNKISNVMLNKNVTITYHKLTDESAKVSYSKLLDKFYQKTSSYQYELNKNDSNVLSDVIDKDMSLRLYGSDLLLSPSSLEMYSKCRYSYFLKYGLRLNEKEKLIFDNREVGTFIHFILEKCISNKVSKQTIKSMVSKYADEYFMINLRPINKTLKYVIDVLKESTVLLLDTILDELDNTKFKPEFTELKIKDMNLSIKLDNGNLNITGIVDRVDSYCDQDNYYYRIIDYKTGVKKFRLDDVLNGLNMQMLIYLLAIKNSNINNRKIIPTGFLYYPALIHNKKMSISSTEQEILKNIRDNIKMNGIINKDNLNLYNDNIGEYLDIKVRNNINPERVLNTNDLDLVFNKVLDVLKQEGNNILNGYINVNPIIDSKNDSCKYCKFNSICKFNKEVNKVRKYKSLTNKEVLQSLEGEKYELD